MSETSFVFKYFPEGEPPSHLKSILEIFAIPETRIDSSQGRLSSNEVLSILRKDLENIGFRVETSKKKKDKIWGSLKKAAYFKRRDNEIHGGSF